MESQLQKSTKYFNTYEEREKAFRDSVFALIPRKYSGPRLFWKDFGRISIEELSQLIKQPIAYITSYPRDCLAFGTPWQVLRAAKLCARKGDRQAFLSEDEVAEDFDISENLSQPIRTLSGGETVKLALAKAFITANYSRRLTIASPFSWLSRDNRIYFNKLLEHYSRYEIPVELFALEGEDSSEPISDLEMTHGALENPVDFTICLKDLRILLSSSLNPIYSEDTYAEVEDIEADLCSPCLILGENGQGKSLIAKTLTRAISFRGSAKIARAKDFGPARLLFQDVITQTLLRSFDMIAGSSSYRTNTKSLELYTEIINAYDFYLEDKEDRDFSPNLTNTGDFRSLLEIKAILVAVRLCSQPAALILDEPDWGLTRSSSIAFVLSIIRISHELGIPVILISHKPWWNTIANSKVHVQRTRKETVDHQAFTFRIQLSCN